MSDIDFKGETDRMLIAMQVIGSLDLEGILATAERAHSLGPFIDPTLYMQQLQSGDMDAVSDLARSLVPAVKVWREKIQPKIPVSS